MRLSFQQLFSRFFQENEGHDQGFCTSKDPYLASRYDSFPIISSLFLPFRHGTSAHLVANLTEDNVTECPQTPLESVARPTSLGILDSLASNNHLGTRHSTYPACVDLLARNPLHNCLAAKAAQPLLTTTQVFPYPTHPRYPSLTSNGTESPVSVDTPLSVNNNGLCVVIRGGDELSHPYPILMDEEMIDTVVGKLSRYLSPLELQFGIDVLDKSGLTQNKFKDEDVLDPAGFSGHQDLPLVGLTVPHCNAWDDSDRSCLMQKPDDHSHLSEPEDYEPPVETYLYHGDTVYTITGILGEGGFGRVFYAHTDGGDEVAIKTFHKPQMYAMDEEKKYCGRNSARKIQDEIDILRTISLETDSPFLTQLLGSFQDERNIYLVMRMYPEDLRNRLLDPPKMDLADIKIYAAELVLALEALHSANILHRDLKPENVLISPNGHLCLADFGMSKVFPRSRKIVKCSAYDYVGTEHYQAPEMLRGAGYTCASDVWGFGLMVLEMFIGDGSPYFLARGSADQVNRLTLLDDIERHVPSHAAVDLLLSILLVRDPRNRPSLEDIKQHSFFDKIIWSKVEARLYTRKSSMCLFEKSNLRLFGILPRRRQRTRK